MASPASGDEITDRSVALGTFIRDRRWDDAQALIDALPPDQRAAPEVLFIEAFIARQRGRPRRAIELYQRLLDQDASLGRVRLELAETFVELGDDRAAEQNYRLALTTDLPPEVRAVVNDALTQLERRDRWRFSVNLAVAPDTNVNAATDAEQAQLFGLPFELSDEARRTSGLNITAAAGAERAFATDGPFSGIVGVSLRGTDNEQTAFDDAAASGRLGVQYVSMGARSELALIGDRRWFGGDWLSSSAGLEFRQRLSNGRTVHDVSLSASRLDYDDSVDRDADVYSLDWDRSRYVSPIFFWRAGAALRLVDAESDAETFAATRVSAGGYHALPAGFGVWAEAAVEQRDFDEAAPLFGVAREDLEISLSLRGIKRDWRVFGYNPYLGALVAQNDSNIELEDYSRTRVEFGLTRTF
ncbi:TPR repeat-containing protein precursor [Terricaulis silvestris]|uniref:TPR repeat-containing protein n=2 Tax=Terricaulis silvestris TaxID=2686094 RepID=A0A6I6MSW7_9CAUL|nr:TPR repeat-containing protein precursor [Terricaulis silvestris]